MPQFSHHCKEMSMASATDHLDNPFSHEHAFTIILKLSKATHVVRIYFLGLLLQGWHVKARRILQHTYTPPMVRTLEEIKEMGTKKSGQNFGCVHQPLLHVSLYHIILDELHLQAVRNLLSKNKADNSGRQPHCKIYDGLLSLAPGIKIVIHWYTQ